MEQYNLVQQATISSVTTDAEEDSYGMVHYIPRVYK